MPSCRSTASRASAATVRPRGRAASSREVSDRSRRSRAAAPSPVARHPPCVAFAGWECSRRQGAASVVDETAPELWHDNCSVSLGQILNVRPTFLAERAQAARRALLAFQLAAQEPLRASGAPAVAVPARRLADALSAASLRRLPMRGRPRQQHLEPEDLGEHLVGARDVGLPRACRCSRATSPRAPGSAPRLVRRSSRVQRRSRMSQSRSAAMPQPSLRSGITAAPTWSVACAQRLVDERA